MRTRDRRPAADRLGDQRHLLLTTFEPDGTEVTTATWVIRDGAALGIWAPADSPAVRRLRAHPTVLVCAGDAHGRPIGARLAARATLCDPDATARYRTSLLNKYGLTGLFALARSRLRLGLDGTVGVRITLAEQYHPLHSPAWRPPDWYCLN
ncbi:PPOX class F420-dependent oxidoreductase [Kitasatospora paracochleata]|uniref:Pyridoxamine 5'-phosphate oxidase putative domain-containing protein n=1 Tax=Kitasatospora paracochleata TaxID=58354 RepID=A0ABT1J3U7_9ACTN|nr:PPOX class F420-dependent oxidoreductase [Kitasatospora paracochleata]MCP2312097.1 hypothetical protein [Kitasatospora paracochleata]